MSQLAIVLIVSWLAGFAAFIGGIIAKIEGTAETEGKRKFVHGVVAFGGGILVAAVAFALAPKGIDSLSPVWLATAFFLGGCTFCILDSHLSKRGGSKAQFMAMLTDFVPEAIALGALFGQDQKTALLLALFISAQNLPEGFNAYRESVSSNQTTRSALITLLIASLLGPASGCMGYLFLQDRLTLTASIMSFAAGGILYIVFQDIAPQSKMERHWSPPLGAVLGFIVGMVGKQLLG